MAKSMKQYKNISGDSGITAYETTENSISVEFNHDALYRYTYESTGKQKIEKMKKLAAEGKGLSTYISQVVKEKFERKLN